MTDDFENLQKKLQEALIEIEQLRQENVQLKTVFKESPSPLVIKPKVKVHQPASALSPFNHQSPVEEKFHCSGGFFAEEKMSIQNVGNQKTTTLEKATGLPYCSPKGLNTFTS